MCSCEHGTKTQRTIPEKKYHENRIIFQLASCFCIDTGPCPMLPAQGSILNALRCQQLCIASAPLSLVATRCLMWRFKKKHARRESKYHSPLQSSPATPQDPHKCCVWRNQKFGIGFPSRKLVAISFLWKKRVNQLSD